MHSRPPDPDGTVRSGPPDKATAPLGVKRNFAWTMLGSLTYGACQWGMIVVLAKLGTTGMVGQFALGLAITGPVIMFTNLQLRAIQATDARHRFAFQDYLGLRLVSLGGALLLIGAIVGFAGYGAAKVGVILVLGVAKAFESVSDLLYGLFQQRERMDRVARSLIVKGLLSLMALGVTVSWTGDLLRGVVAVALTWAAVLLLYDVPVCVVLLRSGGDDRRPIFCPRLVPTTLRALFLLALPLGLTRLLLSLQTNVPRYYVEHHLGEEALGVFAAIGYLIIVGNRVVHAFCQSTSPRMARLFVQGRYRTFLRFLSAQLGLALLLFGAGVVVALVAGKEMLTLLYSAEYGRHTTVLLWVMLVAGFGYLTIVIEYTLTIARRLRVQLVLLASAVVVLIVASAALVPWYGLVGAAAAMAAAAAAHLVGGAVVTWRALRTAGGG